MTATALALPQDCSIPDWLSSCLLEHSGQANLHDLPEAHDPLQVLEGSAKSSESEAQISLPVSPPPVSPPTDGNQLVCRAFEFAYQLHRGQMRASGDPYIAHPVAVAGLLRSLGGDSAMIAAGFLHDVVEDTEVTVEEIEAAFGPEVRHLVEGVTKLSKLNFDSKTEQQAENFRRMFFGDGPRYSRDCGEASRPSA